MKRLFFVLVLFAMGTVVAWAQTKPMKKTVQVDSIAKRNVTGIDVSRHNGIIDWKQVAQSGIQFAFIKATEGSNLVDPCFAANIQESRKSGLLVGIYHYFSTLSGARTQFENFSRTVKQYGFDLVPAVNVESYRGYTPQQLCDSLRLFVQLVEEEFGRSPIIYTYETFYKRMPQGGFGDCLMWVGKYIGEPTVISDWVLWQFSESGECPGIRGLVDLNVLCEGCRLDDLLLPKRET